MKRKDLIITDKTLKDYKEKYRNLNGLLKYSKAQVEEFDKVNSHYFYNNGKQFYNYKNFLLQGHDWYLINDTYYEIPKAPRWTWFRNLHAGIQIGTCCLLGAGVVTAIITPVVVTLCKTPIVIYDSQSFEGIEKKDEELIKKCFVISKEKLPDGNTKVKLKIEGEASDKYEIQKILRVLMGNDTLELDKDYTISFNRETGEVDVLILQEAEKTHQGDVQVVPKFAVKVTHISSIKLAKTMIGLQKKDSYCESNTLTPKILPEDAKDKSVVWESSDPSIVSVDDKGTIKAVSEGDAVITVTTKDDNHKATCKVRVSDFTSYLTFTENGNYSTVKFNSAGLSKLPSDKVVYIPDNDPTNNHKPVTEIEDSGFINNNDILGVTFPSSLNNINQKAFQNCKMMKTITFNGDKSNGECVIGAYAFENCYRLNSVSFAPNIKKIGEYAFRIATFAYDPGLTEATFADDGILETIDTEAFGQTKIKTITLPASLKSIGTTTFVRCYELESVKFAQNSQFTTIGVNAFTECKKLESIVLPSSLKTIYKFAFTYCESLKTITIPKSVETMGGNSSSDTNGNIFQNCNSLNEIVFEDLTHNWKVVNKTDFTPSSDPTYNANQIKTTNKMTKINS